jgi:putative membrane protein
MNFTLSGSAHRTSYLRNPVLWVLTGLFLVFCLYSGFTTPDLVNWLLENMLTFSYLIVLVAFYRHFRFSNLSYTLMILFLLLHMYGSHYGTPQASICGISSRSSETRMTGWCISVSG